jgi:hypothetical protein
MNTYRNLLAKASICCALSSTTALGAPRATVDIQYVQPAKFTDFRIYGRDAHVREMA